MGAFGPLRTPRLLPGKIVELGQDSDTPSLPLGTECLALPLSGDVAVEATEEQLSKHGEGITIARLWRG